MRDVHYRGVRRRCPNTYFELVVGRQLESHRAQHRAGISFVAVLA